MSSKKVRSALISVFHKTGLDEIAQELHRLDIKMYSTGGTHKYINDLGIPVNAVEELTSYPSILGGRVKTLHPKIFGGILAKREAEHQTQLAEYDIPEIDLVIVDLYPFEETVATTDDEDQIIEKIDIGGISLIRAAAKNYKDILVVPSRHEYPDLLSILKEGSGSTTAEERMRFARKAFAISSHYDSAIHNYFERHESSKETLRISHSQASTLRYGENPHQQGVYFGDIEGMFDNLGGKALSYNNLVDVDAAVGLMYEFKDSPPTFAILKHTNACGLASRATVLEAWKEALKGDPVSAFGGILICNAEIDLDTAHEIDKIFYEVVIAPSFSSEALAHLQKKKKRIILKQKDWGIQNVKVKSILNGIIHQDNDLSVQSQTDLECKTNRKPSEAEIEQLLFANKLAKHLKSNTIVLAKDNQLCGMGCGQTSRVDACKQAIDKAIRMGFDLTGAVIASDAFFPFPDCVELAHKAGITAVIQPGGSIKDQLSIDYCNENDLAMVFTGVRHFKH